MTIAMNPMNTLHSFLSLLTDKIGASALPLGYLLLLACFFLVSLAFVGAYTKVAKLCGWHRVKNMRRNTHKGRPTYGVKI